MPWTKNDYPSSWKNFDEPVKNKAIEIANALIEEGYKEGRAIAIATDQAKETVQSDDQTTFIITTHDKGWQLKEKGKERAIYVEETKSDIEDKSKPYVNKQNGKLIIYKEDGSIDQTLYET